MIKKYLVGDDHPTVARGLGWVLQDAEIDAAYTPEDVIAKAKQTRYNAIVTDLNYASDDLRQEGFEVLGAIRELSPIRILYTSSADDEQVVKKAMESGATHVFEKSKVLDLIDFLNGLH